MTTAWQTVALREIAVRATAKSFLTSLAVTLVLIIGGIAAYSWFSDRGTENTVAVSSSQAQRYVEQAETTLHESSAQDSLTPERVGRIRRPSTASNGTRRTWPSSSVGVTGASSPRTGPPPSTPAS